MESLKAVMAAKYPKDAQAAPTIEEFKTAALGYLSRYAASTSVLRNVLVRRARRRMGSGGDLDPAVAETIDAVVAALVAKKFINDDDYAEARVSSLARRGDSERAIRSRLWRDGIVRDLADRVIEESGLDDEKSAIRFAKRKRLGPWRPRPDAEKRNRDIAAMIRAGFGYGLACRTLNLAPDFDVVEDDCDF